MAKQAVQAIINNHVDLRGYQVAKKRYRLNALGKLLAKVPRNKKWLWPFYLAGQLNLVEDTFSSPAMPEEWDGFRIVYFSDVHFGPMFSAQRARDLIMKINALNADLVLLGGDYGETALAGVDFFEAIPPIHAKHGVLAAIGNHDLHGSQKDNKKLKETMRHKGIMVLENDCHILRGKDSVLRFCATDDIRSGKPDADILNGPTPEGQTTFTVYFPHSPDILPGILTNGQKKFDLGIFGHTHGGQIAPFGHSLHSSSRWGDRYRTGWMIERGHEMLISNGVGTSLIPVRIGAPPQYHLITLRPGEPISAAAPAAR